MDLRPYQTDIIKRFHGEVLTGRRRVLMVAPTGAGKTVIAGDIARSAVGESRRVLFFAHRRELIFQASKRLHELGCDHGVILPDHPTQLTMPVQVASIQTLHARAMRSDCMRLPPADLIVCDEAHHAPARTYQQLLKAYPSAVVLGPTATPCRADGRGLGNTFDSLIECPGIPELISLGYLVPTHVFAPPLKADIRGIPISRTDGDYVRSEAERRLNTDELVGDVIEHWLRLGRRRPTVVFAGGVAHSIHIRNEFRRAGVLAEHIDADTPKDERDQILKSQEKGSVEVIVNAEVLVEGWDQPCIECIILARLTKSLGRYRQFVGRGLRTHPGKTHLTLLDHAGSTFMHGLIEDPIEWTLEPDKRAENKTHSARMGNGDRPSLMTNCPECKAVMLRGKPCEACGWRPVRKPDGFDFADGQLVAVTANGSSTQTFNEDQKSAFYKQVIWIGKERGYKPGWASVQYKERFGHWPPIPRTAPQPDPEPPAPAVIAWVRQKTLQWLRSQQGRGR